MRFSTSVFTLARLSLAACILGFPVSKFSSLNSCFSAFFNLASSLLSSSKPALASNANVAGCSFSRPASCAASVLVASTPLASVAPALVAAAPVSDGTTTLVLAPVADCPIPATFGAPCCAK